MQLDIPLSWCTVLSRIKTVGFPRAVIAGGALRDRFHGKPVKDIDIFLPWSDAIPAALDDTLGQNHKTILTESSCDYLVAMTDVASVLEYDLRHFSVYAPVQIVALKPDFPYSLANVLRRFDFGLCQIAFDGSSFTTSEHFKGDVENKTMTLTRADDAEQVKRSMERYERLQEKYPDYTLVVPEEFKVVYDEWRTAQEELEALTAELATLSG